MPLINCEIRVQLKWSKRCISVTGAAANKVSDTKFYAPAAALLTQNNVKLFKQLKSGFERTINWNKYQSKKQMKRKADI